MKKFKPLAGTDEDGGSSSQEKDSKLQGDDLDQGEATEVSVDDGVRKMAIVSASRCCFC